MAADFTARVNGQPVSATFNNNKLTFDKPANVNAGETVSIYVAGAKDYAGNLLTPYTGNVTIPTDTRALNITSVAQKESNVFQITFNKKIKAGTPADAVRDALTILKDGAPLTRTTDWTVAVDADDTTGTKFYVTVNVASAGVPNYGIYTDTNKSVDLDLVFAKNALEDIYGNKNLEIKSKVTLVKDELAPAVKSVKLSNDEKKILVTFDKALANLSTSDVVVRKDGAAHTAGTSTINATDAKILEIPNAGSAVYAPGTYTVRLNAAAVTDKNNNPVKAQTLENIVVKGLSADLEATTIGNLSSTNNEFQVIFNKAVTQASALNLSNYKLDGKALPAGTDIYFADSSNDKVNIVLPANSVNIGVVSTGTNAILSVANIETALGQKVVPNSGTVKVEDNTPALVKSAKIVGNTITLTFDENLGTIPANIDELIADFKIKGDGVDFVKGSTNAATAVIDKDGKTLIVTIVKDASDDSNWDAIKASNKITITTVASPSNTKDANALAIKGGETVTVAK